jgi:hypothetical protein
MMVENKLDPSQAIRLSLSTFFSGGEWGVGGGSL